MHINTDSGPVICPLYLMCFLCAFPGQYRHKLFLQLHEALDLTRCQTPLEPPHTTVFRSAPLLCAILRHYPVYPYFSCTCSSYFSCLWIRFVIPDTWNHGADNLLHLASSFNKIWDCSRLLYICVIIVTSGAYLGIVAWLAYFLI